MFDILKDLFVNVLIIVSSLSLGNMLTRDRETVVKKRASLPLGILSGILGCLLMIYSVKVTDVIIIDFRCIPIIIMGVYISFSSALLSAAIIGLFRLLYFGVDTVSIVALAITVICGIYCGAVGKLKITTVKKWGIAFFGVVIITSSGFVFLVQNQIMLKDILISYIIGMTVVAAVSFLLMSYIMKSNMMYYNMESAGSIDFLTGVYNVRSFDFALQRACEHAKNTNSCISLLYIDIDHFKQVNDTYGHISGDKVLRDFAHLLVEESRDIDIVSRNGGEEFSIILKNCRQASALQIADRLREKVEQTQFISVEGDAIHVTVSIGIASYPENASDIEKLIILSDKALYSAKESGRNRVRVAV